MAEFDAERALSEAQERHEHLVEGGDRLAPVSAAVIAVLAALATLFANHGSTSTLSEKNEAILYQSKASDQYNYYESKRIKVHLLQALLDAGLVGSAKARSAFAVTINAEQTAAKRILAKAREDDAKVREHAAASEGHMAAYESDEIAATFFEVSVVLASLTALLRTRLFLYAAWAGSLVGLGFFIAGFAR